MYSIFIEISRDPSRILGCTFEREHLVKETNKQINKQNHVSSFKPIQLSKGKMIVKFSDFLREDLLDVTLSQDNSGDKAGFQKDLLTAYHKF